MPINVYVDVAPLLFKKPKVYSTKLRFPLYAVSIYCY